MAELRQPIETRPQAVVENVHPIPGQQPPVGDFDSADRMEDFLWERLEPDAEFIQGGVLKVPDGTRSVTYPQFSGWRNWLDRDKVANSSSKHWKRFLAINMAVNAALNLLNGNAAHAVADVVDEVHAIKDYIEDWAGIGVEIDRCAVRTEVPTTVSRTTTESFEFNSSGVNQPVGEAVRDDLIVDTVLDHIEDNTTQTSDRTSELVSGDIEAVSSDDYRADSIMSGVGRPNRENVDLAEARLRETQELFLTEAVARGIDLEATNFTFSELVLDDVQQLRLTNAIRANGFDEAQYATDAEAIDAALAVYNERPEELDESLRVTMRELLPRGFRAELVYRVTEQIPGESEIDCEPGLTPDGEPGDSNRDYDLWLIPLPLVPFPQFRRAIKEWTRWRTIAIPGIDPDPEYLKLYPEARTEQDTLVKSAWSLDRKYQHLMREDDRIQRLLTFDYIDSEGEQQRLQAMFIDHVPTDDTLEFMRSMFEIISQMQGGRVGREMDMFAVYPSENAGVEHGNPKKIGLGQDIQYERGTLGVAYPALRLVEMHMPPETTADDLGEHNSPDWIMAHEIAGHFTDLNDEDNELEDTGYDLPNGATVYTTNNRWEHTAAANYRIAEAEELSEQPSRYTVYRQVVDRNGNIVDMEHEVTDPIREPRSRLLRAIRRATRAIRNQDGMTSGDPRFAEAQLIRKETGHPTRYGATIDLEHYPEAAASEVTGTEIPFDQAHDGQGINLTDLRFAQGYRVSSRDREMLAERWGSDSSDPFSGVEFEENPVQWLASWFGRPQDEPRLATMMNRARQTPLPAEEDLLHIITGRRIGD